MVRKLSPGTLAAAVRRHGTKILPADHPIYSEGPTITIISTIGKTVKPSHAPQIPEDELHERPEDRDADVLTS